VLLKGVAARSSDGIGDPVRNPDGCDGHGGCCKAVSVMKPETRTWFGHRTRHKGRQGATIDPKARHGASTLLNFREAMCPKKLGCASSMRPDGWQEVMCHSKGCLCCCERMGGRVGRVHQSESELSELRETCWWSRSTSLVRVGMGGEKRLERARWAL
jgi:hypothetical protein